MNEACDQRIDTGSRHARDQSERQVVCDRRCDPRHLGNPAEQPVTEVVIGNVETTEPQVRRRRVLVRHHGVQHGQIHRLLGTSDVWIVGLQRGERGERYEKYKLRQQKITPSPPHERNKLSPTRPNNVDPTNDGDRNQNRPPDGTYRRSDSDEAEQPDRSANCQQPEWSRECNAAVSQIT